VVFVNSQIAVGHRMRDRRRIIGESGDAGMSRVSLGGFLFDSRMDSSRIRRGSPEQAPCILFYCSNLLLQRMQFTIPASPSFIFVYTYLQQVFRIRQRSLYYCGNASMAPLVTLGVRTAIKSFPVWLSYPAYSVPMSAAGPK